MSRLHRDDVGTPIEEAGCGKRVLVNLVRGCWVGGPRAAAALVDHLFLLPRSPPTPARRSAGGGRRSRRARRVGHARVSARRRVGRPAAQRGSAVSRERQHAPRAARRLRARLARPPPAPAPTHYAALPACSQALLLDVVPLCTAGAGVYSVRTRAAGGEQLVFFLLGGAVRRTRIFATSRAHARRPLQVVSCTLEANRGAADWRNTAAGGALTGALVLGVKQRSASAAPRAAVRGREEETEALYCICFNCVRRFYPRPARAGARGARRRAALLRGRGRPRRAGHDDGDARRV